MRVTSSASAALSRGRIEGARSASIVLPVPGAPLSSRLCPPAAAITSVRTAWSCPRTSVRSGSSRAGSLEGAGGQRVPAPAAENAYRAVETLDDADPQTVDEPSLVCAGWRERDPLQAGAARRVGDREGAASGLDRAVQAELAEERIAVEALARQLARGAEDRAGEREVESRPGLGDVARREVCCDPPSRELEAGVEDRGADALAGLAHSGIGEADDREAGQPWAHVDLDGHVPCAESFDRERVRAGQHRQSLPLARVEGGAG